MKECSKVLNKETGFKGFPGFIEINIIKIFIIINNKNRFYTFVNKGY